MRLRQLGSSQSVLFCAPPEVRQSILDVCNKRPEHCIDSAHVVQWLLEQTCRGNEQLRSLYLSQGADFCLRTNAQWKNSNFLTNETERKSYLDVIQRVEQESLEKLYGNKAEARPEYHSEPLPKVLQMFKENLLIQD